MSLLVARDLWVAPPADGSRNEAPGDPVVRGLSLEVGTGEWVAVTGPNGCGKTTLLLALAGLWPARSGTLLLNGQPFGPGVNVELRRQLAVIMQDPSSQLVQPTVRDEIGFAALNLGISEGVVADRIARWSERLGLAEELARDPQELSAGRQQMVLVAGALVAGPSLLLADEPLCHLDHQAREAVLGAVKEEVARGLAVVWVTQDRTECSMASRVLSLGVSAGLEVVPVKGDGHNARGPMVRLAVSPWNGVAGPSVRTSVPIEILVERSGVTAVLGPNGVGKSVLLAAACGASSNPQVLVKWADGQWTPPLVSSQYPELEIFEEWVDDELVYAAVCRGVSRAEALQRARAILERLGAGRTLIGRRTWSLSGGEKRLVSLAGALVAPTSLLALDEPTAGLDHARRAALAMVVGDVAQKCAVLVASQDSEWLSAISARCYAMGNRGPFPAATHSEKTD